MSDEPEPEPSRAAGGCVLATAVGAAIAILFATAPTAGVLLVWATGTACLWLAVRRPPRPVHDTADHSPPPPTTPTANTEVQVRTVGAGGGVIVYPPGSRITHHPSTDPATG
jgi:hypothetical protein